MGTDIRAHAVRSPSSAKTWLLCPGSIHMQAGIPDGSSPQADLGTAAHTLAEYCLENGKDPNDYIGCNLGHDTEHGPFLMTAEWTHHISKYVKYVRDKSQGMPLRLEQRVPISPWTGEPGAEGTSDAIAGPDDDGTLHVIDLKFGLGRVRAQTNYQLRLYALGSYESLGRPCDVARVTMHIVQPRIDWLDTETMEIADLLTWGINARKRAMRTYDDDAPLRPGDDQCRWCKAKFSCPESVWTRGINLEEW